MEYIVLDTNCLILSLPEKSPYHQVWRSFLQGDYTLCVSNEIMDEYMPRLLAVFGVKILPTTC